LIRARTLVVVNYHAAALSRRAIETARAASAEPLEVIVVDNSGDDAELARVGALGADRVIAAPDNPGYGEGANRGAAVAEGEALIIANPDVEFGPGSIDALVGALDEKRAGMAGPRFSWDEAGAWLLPPPDVPSRSGEVARWLASRSPRWRSAWRRRRRDRRIRFWRATSTVETDALSGAVLTIRRETLQRVGGFDPRFRLYFEEIDLMVRLRKGGERLLHVSSARVHHLYNQSAGRSETAAARYTESEFRFLSKWHGEGFARWALSSRKPLPPPPFQRATRRDALTLPRGEWLIEASPLEDFATAAGSFSSGGSIEIPDEILENLRGEELFLMATELATGRPGLAVRLAKTE
jgi:N-acetylglucosaminyl-diphospho-decaprenol L-rhamnosyltransferase